jgi:hypothetical protein
MPEEGVAPNTLPEISRNNNNRENKEKEPGIWVLCPGKLNGISGCYPVDRAGTVKPCEQNICIKSRGHFLFFGTPV